VIPLRIPPLRIRKEDIIPLALHMLDQMVGDAPGSRLRMDARAEDMLRSHDWPGNARELSNVLERIVSSLDGDLIEPRHLPFPLFSGPKVSTSETPRNLRDVMNRAEKDALRAALAGAKGNKARAAKLLGIHRTQLYKKMRKHGLPVE
jgi:transcriptional regulator with PAS, ATPase and Fis domain